MVSSRRIYEKKYVNGLMDLSIQKDIKKIEKLNQARYLIRPRARSIHLCHKKPNPARETVSYIGRSQGLLNRKGTLNGFCESFVRFRDEFGKVVRKIMQTLFQ
jgi:hypothetical protein